MFANKLHIRLPRRITAYFLLFGLTALVWLCAGLVYVAYTVSDSRTESASLRSLGRGGDRLTLTLLRKNAADVQAALSELRLQSGADYCAVVSSTGEYLGHTQAELKGKLANEVGSTTDHWGQIERVEFTDGEGRAIHEYRTPLKAADGSVCSLRLGFGKYAFWNYLSDGVRVAPLALLGPALCMIAGAVLINRMVRPVADIEHQLQQVAMSPSIESCEWHEVAGLGAAALGWNRVVQQKLAANERESLAVRVRGSLDLGRQDRIDSVLNSIPDGVATSDATGRLSYVNVPMSVLLGLKEPPAGDGATESGSGTVITQQLADRWDLPANDELLADENRNRTVISELTREENGQRRVIRVARHPIYAGGGKQETHVWLIRDVTQQKLAQDMRDQFVDTATHELRTPLANIKAYAETLALADVIDVEQQKQFLNTINSEATRLARFVDDLLSVSSMELGSLSLNKQVTDLGRMLNEVLAKIRPQVDEKRLALEVKFPEKMPEPELDKDKISAVLVNLLGNAVKYTPNGGRVNFRVNITDQQIEASIEDTGVGIAADELPKVFDKFFRSPDPRVQEQTGTGLGLALANEVVRLHGGRITVESEINKGSTFTVLLPMT